MIECTALVCKNNKEGICTAASIKIIDIEENENIKMKDRNFMVCNNFEEEY